MKFQLNDGTWVQCSPAELAEYNIALSTSVSEVKATGTSGFRAGTLRSVVETPAKPEPKPNPEAKTELTLDVTEPEVVVRKPLQALNIDDVDKLVTRLMELSAELKRSKAIDRVITDDGTVEFYVNGRRFRKLGPTELRIMYTLKVLLIQLKGTGVRRVSYRQIAEFMKVDVSHIQSTLGKLYKKGLVDHDINAWGLTAHGRKVKLIHGAERA